MVTERSIEVEWVCAQLPETGRILDIGSCESSHLEYLNRFELHCLDTRDCHDNIPDDATFFQESLLGNALPINHFDTIISISTLEHIGMPHYGQQYIPDGDVLALHEIWRLLKVDGLILLTVPCGISKVTSWYRQYDPSQIHLLMVGWGDVLITYWCFDESQSEYVPIDADEVTHYDYFDVINDNQRAGAVAGISARKTV